MNKTIDQQRQQAAGDLMAYEAAFSHDPSGGPMVRVQFPDGHIALVAARNVPGALSCGGKVVEAPPLKPTVNGIPALPIVGK